MPTKLTDLHFVSLDWITPHAEAVVAEHARVSTKEPKREEYKKLLKYCIKHGHWSVYEQVCASFSIYTSRAVSFVGADGGEGGSELVLAAKGLGVL